MAKDRIVADVDPIVKEKLLQMSMASEKSMTVIITGLINEQYRKSESKIPQVIKDYFKKEAK